MKVLFVNSFRYLIILVFYLFISAQLNIIELGYTQSCQFGGYCVTEDMSSSCPNGYNQQRDITGSCPELPAGAQICCVPINTPTPTPAVCKVFGQTCSGSSPCCSNQGLNCLFGSCCKHSGSSCSSNSDCCGMMTCNNGTCQNPSGGGGSVCGNGFCESGENSSNCSVDCGGGGGGPQPTQRPTSTPRGGNNMCNTPCSVDSQCAGASDGCTKCLAPPGGGLKRCRTPNTPTATPRPQNTPTSAPTRYDLTAVAYVDVNNNGQFDSQSGFYLISTGQYVYPDVEPYLTILRNPPYNSLFEYRTGEDLPLRVEVNVRRSGYNATRYTSSSTGSTVFSNLQSGTYTASFYTPTGYRPRESNNSVISRSVSLTGNRTVSVGFIPEEQTSTPTPIPEPATSIIEGSVVSNPSGECSLIDAIPADPGIQVNINNSNGDSNGSYTTGPDGNYLISVTDLPNAGQYITLSNIGSQTVTCVLINGVPNTDITSATYGPFDITNIDNITFILKPNKPWFMTEIGDVRQPSIQNNVPVGKLPTKIGSTASIFYSTSVSALLGAANQLNDIWRVDAEYSQVNAINRPGNASFTFYKQRQEQNSGVDRASLPGCRPNEDCNFIADLHALVDQTFYYVSGNLNFNPQGGNTSIRPDSRIIILAEGDITINKNVLVTGSDSLLIFAAKNDIIITEEVGESNPLSESPNIQAILSAENNVEIKGKANCPAEPDLRLNIEGSLIANADNPFGIDSNGGKLIYDSRTLCAQDANNPVLYVKPRLSFITSLSDFYKVSTSTWNEVEP